ncbi:MAG TPA: glycogen-binding domain-containing protein [Gemmatimonadales bacterium]|nr:glycogen-binding domain-containing protein [Gemmatimonadales bacterium]
MPRTMSALLVAASLAAAPLAAQVDASVGLGVGTVRYPGGSSFGSAVLSPALRYTSSALVIDGSGGVASLPGSAWSSQGRATFWGTTPPVEGGLRLGAEATFAGTTLSDGTATGAAHGLAELTWSAPAWGVGLGAGPSTGFISGGLPVVALHTRARAWWRASDGPAAPDLQVALEPTRFPDAWFTDASATATLERRHSVVSVSVAGRIARQGASKAAGSVALQWFVAPRVSLELGGGSTLNDPYQDLPRTGFISLGVRLHGSSRPTGGAAPTAKLTPLVAEMRGDSVVVRFRMPGAKSVAIAGDWNGWEQADLRALGDDVWEKALMLRRGLYHFNLLVDGFDWVVPNGVATVPDGLGGMVAVLIVP